MVVCTANLSAAALNSLVWIFLVVLVVMNHLWLRHYSLGEVSRINIKDQYQKSSRSITKMCVLLAEDQQ